VSNLDVDCLFGNINSCFVNSRELIKNWINTAAVDGSITNLGQAVVGPPSITEANLLYRVYVPTVQVPMVLSIPYMEPVIYREPIPAFGAGAQRKQSINTRTFQLAQVPHRILLFARPRGQFDDDLNPEAFLTIEKIQFRTSSDSGGLANASIAQLFQISQRNGLNMSYDKFARDIGSIVVLDLEKGDIGGFVPGTRESFTFDISVGFTNNLNTRPIALNVFEDAVGTAPVKTTFDFYIVCQMDSKMILDGTNCTLVNGENQELVKQVLAERPVSLVGDQGTGRGLMVGGSWKGFTRFINGAVRGVGDVLGMGKNVMGVVNQARGLLGRGVGDPQGYPGPYGGGLRVLG
jgi:hypothetical protein